MAKIYGLFGSMTGKLADVVMSVRNGEQIARKYQPVVFNPSTPAQVAQRAKLKLLSQLSAVMAPVIAMRREGAVSSRNIFTKVNFPATSYSNDTADIELLDIKITRSVLSLPRVTANLQGNSLSVQLYSGIEGLSRVVYSAFYREVDNTLRYLGSKVVTEGGAYNAYPTTFDNANASTIVYAYGVRDNTEAARTIFGDMQTPTAEEVAKLIVSRTLTEADVTLTETKAAAVTVTNNSVAPDPDETRSTRKK